MSFDADAVAPNRSRQRFFVMTNPIPISERNWHSWYNHRGWRSRRAVQLATEPLCATCIARGIPTPAVVADHIESHRGNWNQFRLGKLQSLCAQCHDREKQQGYSGAVDDDGWPTDARHPAYRFARK
jgi:5-methylcytosine-specific restriction endonuclease McrA